jgi:Ca2+-binding RTX toxin-like protein
MAYTVTGTTGDDTLDQSTDAGPGVVHGLDGHDSILAGTGGVNFYGDAGNDTVVLQDGNFGKVSGSTGNDSVYAAGDIGSMTLYGDLGADTIDAWQSHQSQTIFGGDGTAATDGKDGDDSIITGDGADLIYGQGGNDTIDGYVGNDTIVGGVGNDSLFDFCPLDHDLVLGDDGNDTIRIYGSGDTVQAGSGNDSVHVSYTVDTIYHLNQGSDTLVVGNNVGGMTVIGGDNIFDGADSIVTGNGADVIYGNGGNDTIVANDGNDTVVGGFGNDSVYFTNNHANLVFGNEGHDTLWVAAGADTVYGGLGNDEIWGGGTGGQLLRGDEGNDTLVGLFGGDTLTGGSGADVFWYATGPGDDSNPAGYIVVRERITDLNFDEDRFRVLHTVGFATDVGSVSASSLSSAASGAIQTALAGLEGGLCHVAVQFSFGGREYLAIDQGGAINWFNDADDLLIDITGATGTIGATDFFV